MRIEAKLLKESVEKALLAHGLSKDCAKRSAKCMVLADLYGVNTHGTVVLPSHIDRIKRGGYNLNPQFQVVEETASFAIIDADNAIGFSSASYCMQYAMDKAREYGIFTVFSNHANAYGAAFCYPMLAAKEGMIGFTCSNSPSAMAPINGKTKLFGTNPLSMVVPAENEKSIIIDMATSKVAKSKFLQAKREGKQLPDGWALDREGNPTNDPDEAIQGLVCPMEGFKGYGLALMIDLIAGLLSGAAWQNHVGRFYNETGEAMNVGHMFVAIDPSRVYGADFGEMMDRYIQEIRKSEAVTQDCPIAVPGDDKHMHYKKNAKCGIEISETLNSVLELA